MCGLSMGRRSTVAVLLAVLFVAFSPRAAAGAGDGQAAPQANAVTVVRALNTSRRFSAPVRTVAALRRMAVANERDLRQVLSMAGLSNISDNVIETLTKGTVTSGTFAPGGQLEWMALRRQKKPTLQRAVRWGGSRAFDGYRFTVKTATTVYSFIVPKDCGNLSLISATAVPPPPPTAPAQVAAPAAAVAAAAVPTPVPAPAPAPPPTPTPAPAPAAPPLRTLTVPAAPVPTQIQPGPSGGGRMTPFVLGAFGKQRRTLGLDGAIGSYCDPLLGFKTGIQYQAKPRFMLAPAVGVAMNLDEGSRTSLFADLEFNHTFETGGYVGTGVGLWDFNHRDNATANILIHAGTLLSRHADNRARTLFAVEARLFLDEMGDTGNNYQFWAGVRYVFP